MKMLNTNRIYEIFQNASVTARKRRILTGKAFFSGCLCIITGLLIGGCTKIEEKPAETTITTAQIQDVSSADPANYIYSCLTDKEREHYDILKKAADSFEEKAVFGEKIEPNELRKLYVSFYNSKQDNFWISSLFYRPEAASDTLDLSYLYTREETEKMKAELDSKTKEILSKIPENATDYEKAKIIHDHIVLNCAFSNTTPYCTTVYGTIVDGQAQCEGYAFAYDYLCRHVGIPCMTVWGTNSEKATHAWNIIFIDGNFYHVDCTWDDPIMNKEVPDFLRHYYFLVRDSDILGTTHFLDSRYFDWPGCNDGENYYIREGLYCTDSSDAQALMKSAALKALDTGALSFGIRCSNKEVFDKACSELFDSSKMRELFREALSETGHTEKAEGFMKYTNEDEYILQVSATLE